MNFIDCDEVAQGFLSLLRGWGVTEVGEAGDNCIALSWRSGRLDWRSDALPAPRGWQKKPPSNVVDAVCDLHFYLLDVYSFRNPGVPCIHAAAIEFERGLVIMPSVQKTGKSTLTAELASRGQRVFCDDLLPLDLGSGEGVALGMLPRLRLPLPDNVTQRYRDFAAAHRGVSDKYCQYLDLNGEAIADYGERLPVVGFVLLERRPEGPAETRDERVAPVLARLIDRQFGGEPDLLGMFKNMRRLVESTQRIAISFSDTAELATALLDRFGTGRYVAAPL